MQHLYKLHDGAMCKKSTGEKFENPHCIILLILHQIPSFEH